MRFAYPLWLLGSVFALVIAAAFIVAGFRLVRDRKVFGVEAAVLGLITHNAANRRALKAVLLTMGVALGFVGLAQPQYGRGTRTIPATNLDVVLVLDYSKSMYAQDVTPSRTERSKVEVARLIRELPGARFAGVAFAGEPMAFPLTSDGAAIAQFFKNLSPNDMPVGGTAIGRALEWGLDLLRRDPQSKDHHKVIILITDGEDLTGDPVSVARTAASEGVVVNVVQIGGRTAEPIPEMSPDGTSQGLRRDEDGKLITTSLSADGEEQLANIAKESGGSVIRGDTGMTGIEEMTRSMRRLMTEQLSEKVETVYADVYAYPVGLGLLLLFLELLIPAAGARFAKPSAPKQTSPTLGARLRAERAAKLKTTGVLLALMSTLSGCERGGSDLFMRFAPQVDQARDSLAASDPEAAAALLQTYLETGKCEEGKLGTGARVRQLPNASFDLGLALFSLAERYGQKFDAAPAPPPAAPPDPAAQEQAQTELAKRSQEVECALTVVQLIASDGKLELKLRAEAYYLAGNLEFLRQDYESAVSFYDQALRLIPGAEHVEGAKENAENAAADRAVAVGNLAAWNRSIALQRIEETPPPPPGDGGAPSPDQEEQEKEQQEKQEENKPEEKQDGEQEKQEENKPEEKQDGEQEKEQEQAGQGQEQPQPGAEQPEQKQAQAGQAKEQPEPASRSQDDRLLDMLEAAPTVQQAQSRQSRARPVTGRDDR